MINETKEKGVKKIISQYESMLDSRSIFLIANLTLERKNFFSRFLGYVCTIFQLDRKTMSDPNLVIYQSDQKGVYKIIRHSLGVLNLMMKDLGPIY